MSPSKASDQPSLKISGISLESLLRLPDKLFVEASYKAILGRPVDADGLANYVAQVQAGVDKMQILVELATSAEGRHRTQELAGLKEAIASYRSGPPSLWTRLNRHLRKIGSEDAAAQMRILENQVLLLEQKLQQQASELRDLRSLVFQLLFDQGKSEILRDFEFELDSKHGAQDLSTPSSNLARTFAALRMSIESARDG